MNAKLLESAIEQLTEIINQWNNMLSRSKYEDVSDLSDLEVISLVTQASAAIKRTSLSNSEYIKQSQKIVSMDGYPGYKLQQLIGVVDALKHDLKRGYIESIEEFIHADVFDDYLDMTTHLMDKKYKDPAAVVAGTTLEIHLRKLCARNGIEVFKDREEDIYKKAEGLNGELKNKEVYVVLDNKNITAWLELRSHAAHGRYEKYNIRQVEAMIMGIKDFIDRNPA